MKLFGWFHKSNPVRDIDDSKFIEFQKSVWNEMPEGYDEAIAARGEGAVTMMNSFVFSYYLNHVHAGAPAYAWQCRNAIIKGLPLENTT